jgi:uncharacterized protein
MEPQFHAVVAPGQALARLVKRDQIVRIAGRSPVHLVLFAADNPRDRLDDSRTRGNQAKFYVSAGDYLISKSNRHIMRIVEDSFAPATHDLATGMSDGTHGPEREAARVCWLSLEMALKPWNIDGCDIPTPLNLFKTVRITSGVGALLEVAHRLDHDSHVGLKAELDSIIAISVAAEGFAARFEIRDEYPMAV